jgi:hypothetical protein
MKKQGKPKYSEKTCPSASLFTTNPTWLDPGLNPGRRGGNPTLLRQTANRWRQGCQPYAPAALYPQVSSFIQPRMIGDGDCGEIGGLKISRGNRSTRKKPAPAPLCPQQIPHD